MRKIGIAVGIVAVLAVLAYLGFYGIGHGWFGRHEEPGVVAQKPIPEDVVRERSSAQASAAQAVEAEDDRQILFGDLHVHTTFSPDAFSFSMPIMQGEGAHPPADACDFARYCSALDFWSINDHAVGLTPRHWQETVESIRQCNAVAGDPENPDMVTFLGWEWTQVGQTPEDHYGHKNVILADLEDGKIPTRPIAAGGFAAAAMDRALPPSAIAWLAILSRERRLVDAGRYLRERLERVPCAPDVPSPQLPDDCYESAPTPEELFRKLDEWGHDAIVIPHGTTWGLYTPPGSTWDKQLVGAQHDPDRQTLIEVFSGHGNSEEYRDWRAVEWDENGEAVCPEPRPDYLPSCWRAGEIIRARCRAAGEKAEECDKRARRARREHVRSGTPAHMTVPAAEVEDWLDAGQCRDCYGPSFNYRPGGSVQYIMSRSWLDAPEEPRRFRFGFVAASDVHTARPGTGYKEFGRRPMTEATGPKSSFWRGLLRRDEEPAAESRPIGMLTLNVLEQVDSERAASFFMTGGLTAVHSAGRSRDAIWSALRRREVYGTSGDRILLWFDLLNPPDGGEAPMGSAARMSAPPRFRVRAVGAFRQRPGCPNYAESALSAERLERLCRGECYHPSDERKAITRIEVIRIRPQISADENAAALIEDPWKILACPGDASGCVVTFEDPDLPGTARDAVYYVRAIQEPSPSVNLDGLRCKWDWAGNCTEVNPCYGDYRTPYDEDCRAMGSERAWSSPIFVDYAG